MLALTLALWLTQGAVEPPPCHGPYGLRSFPTCFDPGTGWLLETGALVREGAPTAELRTGFLLRTSRTSHSKGTPWINTHRLGVTEAWLSPERRGLITTLYEGQLRRHLEEGFILVPTAHPVRIPFPFDLTFSVRLGHYERRVWEGPGWTLETGQAAVLLDPLRSGSPRLWLGVGPAASHLLRSSRQGLTQELSPFTSLLLDAGYETEDGGWVMRATALAGWTLGLDSGPRARTRAEASLERLVLAVNDQPLWVRLSASHVHADAGVARGDEWTVGLGLTLRAGSAR